jgi:hypothetical protein
MRGSIDRENRLRITWISAGRPQYLEVPSVEMAERAQDVLERLGPTSDIDVDPAALYTALKESAADAFRPGQRGSKGNENLDRYYRFATPRPVHRPPDEWEQNPHPAVPQQIDGFTVVTAIFNRPFEWRVLTRKNDNRWHTTTVRWVDGEYQVVLPSSKEMDASGRGYPTYQSAFMALMGAGMGDSRETDDESEVAEIDKVLEADLYRTRTNQNFGGLSDAEIRHLLNRRAAVLQLLD